MPPVESRLSDPESRLWPRLTAATLALALVLRLLLIARGGQGYWPDETRYMTALSAVRNLSAGHVRAGLLELIGTADHLFFKIVALPAVLLDARLGVSPWRAAAYLSLFSVAALALLGSCARAAGARRREAFLAVFFATCANSLFYYSRHLFPYDASLCFFLASLALGLRPTSARLSFLAGILSGLGFLTYVGYWMLGAAILLLHVARARGLRSAIVRALAAGAGLVLPIAAAVLGARALGGDLVLSFRRFSTTIFQGDFGRGHAFVWEYLWSAEGGTLLLWLGAMAYVAVRAVRPRFEPRPWMWIGMAAALCAGLVVSADVLRTFVVYGRTARMLVPFACLVAAWAMDDAWSRYRLPMPAAAAGLALAALLAALNFQAPFRAVFTGEFMAQARKLIEASGPAVFWFENTRWLRPGEKADDARPGEVLLERRHPFHFRAYLFEGYNEAQRDYLAKHDVDMKLKRMGVAAGQGLNGYPGPLLLRIRFIAGRVGASEPLLVAGEGKDACILFVRYDDPGHVSFGYDSAASGLVICTPVPVDYARSHDLLVSAGALWPGPTDAPGSAGGSQPMARLRRTLLLALDGSTVMESEIGEGASPISGIKLGVNLGPLTTAATLLGSTIESVENAGIPEVSARLWPALAGDVRGGPDWFGYPGPLRLSVVVAQLGELAEPILSAGRSGNAMDLSISRGEKGELFVDFTRIGAASIRSLPISPGPDRRLELVVSMGSMMPPPTSALYADHPEWRRLQDEVFVEANGRPVLALSSRVPSSQPGDILLFTNSLDNRRVASVFHGRVETAAAAGPDGVLAVLPPLGESLVSAPPADDKYPGALMLKVTFPSDSEATTEPLLATGIASAGDLVFLRHMGRGKARIGLDHWGYGGPVSEAFDLPADGRPHEVVISDGALYPPAGSRFYTEHPEYAVLRDWVAVALDGRPVLLSRAAAYPSRAEKISPGRNSIGASTANELFSGELLKVERAPPEMVLAWIRQEGDAARPPGAR